MDNEENKNVSTKNRMTALMLCWFLGLFGVHRLYAGKLGSGFLFLYGTVSISYFLTLPRMPPGRACRPPARTSDGICHRQRC